MTLAETYINRLANPHRLCHRYWVHDSILVGGNVVDEYDWKHLRDDFGVASVLNLDHISDGGKGIIRLSECPFEDNGKPIHKGLIRHAVSFAKMVIGFGPMYIHCHLGVSRSPALAYGVLRWVYELSPKDALHAIRTSGSEWGASYGEHPVQKAYLESIDAAF